MRDVCQYYDRVPTSFCLRDRYSQVREGDRWFCKRHWFWWLDNRARAMFRGKA